MANKDDDFDFKWDDDASFDSELDNFGGDVNEYHPDEVKDAKKDRNPVISKLKSIAPTIHDAGSAVLAGAGKQIGKSIEDNVPEVYQTYTNATYVLSEAETLRNQVTDKVKPWWNDTKRTLRRLSQQLEGQMPFGLDKKILKLVGEEERDQQYKQPSKEDMRREQMNSNINDIFELQMQKSMEQQKDNILNRTLDRRVANIHHKENAGFLSKIAENAVFQHAFTSSVFTAYLKKDLELKYKHFYIAEDTLEVFKNHARAVDNKLDAVIKNTALPEADKVYMSERISSGLKNKLADTFNNKLQNYFGEVSKKILRHVNEGLDLGKILTDALGSQVDMLEIMNDPEMAAMGGMGSEPSLFSKKGLMHLALGNIGGFFAKRALKPLWNKVPQETQELLKQYFRKGRNGLALLMDDLRSGRIKGVPDELKSLLQAITPKLNDKLDKGFVLNEGFQTLDQGAKFTTKFVKTVEDIIPGYLAMQTRYLEMMATNKDSGIQTWNFKTMSFENEKDRWARTRERIDVSNDAGGYRLKTAVVETRKMLEHKAQRYGATGDLIMDRVKKSLQAYHPEIELFIVNLAYSDEYYQVKPDEFVKELDAIVKAESMDDLAKMPLYNIGFEDIEHVKQVAGFWLDMLADRSRDGKTEVMPDKAAIVSFNNRLLDERSNITRSYTAIAEDELRQGNFDVLRALGAKVDSKGNFVYNLRALRRNEFKTTNKININEDISKEEIEKYNETFQYREWANANDKNALLERLKNFLGNIKNMNPRDVVDSGGKGMFAWFWKKFKGENKEKEMEKAWEKVLHGVDVTKDFLVNAYNDATNTLEGWYKQLHIHSVQELLDIIANADSKNEKAWRLLKRMLIVKNAEGKNELRDLSDLDAAEWYDWFSHLSNPSSAAEQFNKGTAASNLLLTLFPLDIKALIFAINNDPDLVKKMKLVNQQFNSNDPETVKQRQDELKKLAGAAIADTKKKIESRSTAYSTMQSAKTDELSKNIAHQVKKAKEDRAYEMNQISTTGFNGTVEHSYAQQQLDVLRHMDAVLGDFYHAFISDKFRADERKRMKETYGSVKDNGEYRHDNGPASKEDKIEFYFNQLNDLYDERNAAKVSKNIKDENEATKKIVNIMKEIYGRDKVNAKNLHDYVVRFDSEYNELKNKDDYVADNRSKIRVNETAEFNPYTLRTENLSAEDMTMYNSVAERDAAIINDIIAKADEHNPDGSKFSDSQKSRMRIKEQRKLFITRAREAFLDQLKNMSDGQFIKAIPYASKIPQIGDTAKKIRDLINNNRDDLLKDVDFYIPMPLVYNILTKDYVKIIDNADKNVQKYWRYAIKRMLTSRMDSLRKYSSTITSLEMMGTFIQPVDNVLEFIKQLHNDVNVALRKGDTSGATKSMARYMFMGKSEQEVKKSFDIDFDDLIQLASAKSMTDYTNINKQLSEKYKRDIDIDNDMLIEALSRISDYRNAEKYKYAQRHNAAGYSSKISDIKTKLSRLSDTTSNIQGESREVLDEFNRRYLNNAEFRRTSDIIELIRNNFSTYEDINENSVESLQRMLTELLQHHEFAEGTTIDDLFEAITGKDYNTTVYGEETDDITSIINNLKGIQPQPEILALPLANSHRKKLNGSKKKTKNKHRLKNAKKHASGGSYDLNEHMQLDDAAAKYIEKAMSKPGGPTATEFKKIQKLHAEALRRFITRNPGMRNAAAEQYLNNGIPVLQWDTNKLSSLSPYDQQVGKMLFGDFYKRGGRYMNAGGRAHGTSIKGKNANAVIELGYDTPVDFNTLFTLDHESQHILDKRAQPGTYNLSKYMGREHIGVGAPWEHYANLGAIKSQIGRGNVDQLIEMMQYLNETANDSVNDNRYLAKQIRRMLHKAGVDTSAYSTTTKSTAQEVDDGTEDIIRQLCKQGRNPKDWDTVSNQEKIQLLYWLKENKANLAGMGINIADSSIDKLIAKYSGSIKKYAKGGNIALAYSKQLLEDKKLDDELRKKYKYGKYFDEKYSSAELMQIRSTLSPQEQQIFDAECADFNNSWLPRFVNRLKPFRSSRWEKHTNGIPVIDANKINQNIKFSPWDREYINALLGVLTTTPALADPTSKLIWARSNNQNKLLKGVLLHEASHIVDKDALPTANISVQDAHSGKGARFEKHADWNAVKRLLAAGDINGVRGFINWLQRFAKEEKNDPHRHITDVGYRADLLIRAAKRYGYDLNQGLKHKRYAKGDNFDVADEIQNYQNRYGELSKITRSRYKDKASNSLIEATLAGKDYNAIVDLENEMPWDVDEGQLQNAIDSAKWCDKLEYLLRKAPILDKTDYYRQWLNIPSTVHVAAIHLKEDTIKKHCPNLDADFWSILAEAKRNLTAMCAIKDPRYKNSGYIIRRLTASDKQYKALELFAIAHELGHIVTERGTIYGTGGDLAHSGRGHYTEKHADMYGLKRYLTDVGPTDLSHIINWLAWTASSSRGDDFAESKSNGSDGRWRSDLIRRYIRMRKHKGDPLYANFKDEYLQSKFRNKYANGDAISFDLPIDQYGGYVDQPTEILGGSGIAGEAGGETIIPHKYNERFKELIYRCLKDTVGENMARRVLRMMKPSDTTQDKLGINLPDASDSRMFAKGGFFKRWWNKLFSHDEEPDKKDQPESNEKRKKLAEELARIMEQLADVDEDNASGPTADLFRRRDELEKELNGLDNPIKTEDKPKEEYTQRHEPTSIRNILLNIMESNEAIYRKMGDGLLVVDLASMLDKLKNTELLKKLKSLKIGERIKNFIFGAYGTGKGLVHGAYNIGKSIVKTAAMNVGSFGRHMFTNKVCDVYLKSEIAGEKHGPKKIEASELINGTIFADKECTKPIYSVADIHPPVYRKVKDADGNETVKEAIGEDERELVNEEGEPLLRFGGKIGRFLRHVATTPLKAILTHKNWERLKGLGSSIMSGIGSGVNGLLDAYCDVYTTKNLEKPLVYGESIKEGRLVRVLEGGKIKVVPTVFDIDGPCSLLIDDPDKPGERKLGNEVIKETDITDGLCHKDGSPIESTKIAKATAMLRRAIGAVGNGIASLTGGAFGIGATVIGWAWNKGKAAAGWVKDRVKDAFTAKDPYIDVCIIKNGKLEVVITGEDLKTNKATLKYCFRDDKGEYKPVLSAYGIDSPVYTMVGEDGKTLEQPRCVIKQEDLDVGVFDTAGNKLTKWAGRSLAGKIGTAALGAVKVGWRALKGLGKGLWNVGKTVLGSIGTLLGEGGATVTGFFTKAWSSTLDFFKNSVISRKDLQEIVGDRLLDIYGLLYKYMPRREYVKGPDLNNDGIVDGSWEDYEQKRKEREAKREQSDKSDKDHPNAERDDGSSFMSKIKEAFLSGFGGGESSTSFLDWVLGGLGLKSFFTGKGAGAAAATNVARAATVTEAAMSGKKGLFKRFASFINGLFARPQNVNGVVKAGGIYNAKKWLKELFFGDPFSDGKKHGIVNEIRGFFHKKGATAAGEATASSATKAGKMATAWNWFKGLFGKGATRAAGAAVGGTATSTTASAATNVAAKAAAKGVLGRIGARLAAGTAANLSGPVIGQIISAGMYLWTGYEIIKYFVTDSSKVKGLRPVRFKAYGVSPKYWEAIEDLETDTFSEFKAGHAEGVPVDRLKKFGYKIDFLDASEMAYGGDKLEYIKTWYRFKFVPFYQKYAQSIIIACKLDPNSQPKGDDIPDEVYSTIILQLTKGFDRINVGPLKELKLDKVSYEKWLAKKREKDREEGLESGKYNNKDLADNTLTGAASKLVGNVSDHLGYAWNEFKHGNILNAIGAVGKAHRAATVKLVAYVAQVVGGFVPGLFMGLFHNEKSTNEKAWDEVRFKLYGLDKTHVSKKEYERISKLIKDFEIHQIHVIDGEEKMVEEDLRDLAEEIFTERVRKNIKSRLSTSGLSTIATSKDLYPESTGFVVSWYKRIFLPIFTLYANAVRAACGNKPGDNIVIDSIPEDQRADLLKEFERQAKAMLAKNIDTEILRLSPDGLFDYLAMRSEEDIAEFAKDSKDLVSEDELGFGAKLSRNLDDAGNDLAKAWSLKFKDPGKALGLAIKGVGKAIWGTFKTVGKSIGQSVADFLHGSANEHRWETRFFDYGFTSRSGSSDVFKNQNLKAMEEFEAEAGKQLLEDNTGKPDEQFFVRIALNSGFIEDCCQKIFGSGSGIGEVTLNATNTRTFKSAIARYGSIFGWIDTIHSTFKNKVFGINTLSELKEKLINYLIGNVKDNVDPNRAKLNIKTKIGDIINYLDFWWTVRFKPVFDTFISVINGYGVEPDDIDVDNIPEESRKQAYDEYKKEVATVLKKDNVLVYNLSAAGCAAYLKQLDEYRNDARDGVINDARNPLAKYYKEKEEEFENTVVASVVANAPALDKEEKFRVAKSLAKASMEIDSELNDVNIMSKYAAKDILAKLGVIDLIHPSRGVKDTIYSILLKLTMGGNYYDKIAKNSATFFRDKTLGELFVDFLENAHKCLYGTDEDNLDKYLKEFAKSCAQSNLFIIKYKGVDILLPNCASLNAWIKTEYRNISIDDPVAVYFGNWFAYRFMPYYAYFVTLVNKATDEKDLKKFPDISKLSVMRRNYIIDKLAKSERKGLISFKAKSMKIDGYSFDAYFRKLSETEGNAKAIGHELRSNGRKFLEERRKELEKQLAEDREKRKAANQSKEGVKQYVEDKNLADVNVLSTGRPGALIGGKNTKRKGRSCTEEERQYIYNFLTSELGLTPEQAAAVMGNMMAESTMSPTAINKDGGGDGAHGLFQWRGPRLKGGGVYTGLIPFAKALGLDPYSVEAQMKYFKHEIETVPYERSQFNSLVRSIVTDPRNPNKTIAQAVVGFRKGFERCGDYEARDSERVGYAKDFYRKYGPGQVPSYMPNTSVLDTATTDNTGTTGANVQNSVGLSNTQRAENNHVYTASGHFNSGKFNTSTVPDITIPDGSNVILPTDSNVITSQFGKRNVKGGSRDHKGIDLRARTGSPVKALKDGVVIKAGGSYNEVFIQHSDGIISKYLHNSKICVRNGQCVKAGELIALAGGKGPKGPNQYGPHLHLGIFKGNTPIDPEIYLRKAGIKLTLKDTKGVPHNTPLSDVDATGTTGDENIIINPSQQTDKVYDNKPDIVSNFREQYKQSMNDATAQASAKVRASQTPVEKPTPASVISNTSTEGTNDNIRTLSAMQTDITNANSGNAPIVSELKLISSILSAFKGDVSGFIHMLTNTAGLTKAGDTTKATTTVTNNKSISDEGLRILVDKLNELAQLITTTNPNVARTSPKYHARDDYMQGYPLQTNKVSS